MEEELRYFVAYLENIRKASHNTVMSYHSDLTKMIAYLHGQGMDSVSAVRTTHLNSYVLLLEKDGMAAATISRAIYICVGSVLALISTAGAAFVLVKLSKEEAAK